MNKKIIEINLTGVQNFLAQAKQTKDLYNGSAMVKEEIQWIKKICAKYFTKIDFHLSPAKDMDGTNGFIMFAETDIVDDSKLEEELGSYLKAEAQAEAGKISADMGLYIACSEYSGDYDKDYLKLQKRLLGKKNSRMQEIILVEAAAGQLNTRSKCVMCGIRPAENAEDPKEGICAECSKKRNFNKQPFPSTLELAGDNQGFYSLVQMDVDDLGMRMAKTEDGFSSNLFKWQEDISGRLWKLAGAVTDIPALKEKNRLIYKGGDDFLMFCPLKDLWELLKCFDESFEKLVNSSEAEMSSLTYSVSITIAHEKIPLRRVVEVTRNGLDQVKNAYADKGKGGIYFMLLERSSGERFCMMNGKKSALYEELRLITEGLKTGAMPRSVVYELEEALSGIGRTAATVDDYRDLQQIICNEAMRIVSRKPGGETYAAPLKELLQMFWDYSSGCFLADNFADLLYILDQWGSCIKGGRK